MPQTAPKRPLPSDMTASMQDYLEAILTLTRDKGAARGRDIARMLNVRKSAVSNALHALAKRGLVDYEPYENVTLTPLGQRIAEEVRRRHNALRRFFTRVLGLDERAADANACRIEHHIDVTALRRMADLADFVDQPSEASPGSWLERFQAFRAGEELEP